MELDKKDALPQNLWEEKSSKSPDLWRFPRCRSSGMPASGMPDRVEQSAEGVLDSSPSSTTCTPKADCSTK